MNNTPYQAPDFTLSDSNNQDHSLADYRGKWVILYFYPKADTPGCTTEACGMRDIRDDLTDLGAEVLAVSRDDASAHEKFKAKYNLNFTLLNDVGGEVVEAYGADNGAMAARKTFIIDPEGQVVQMYDSVTPEGHGEQVLSDLRSLQTA